MSRGYDLRGCEVVRTSGAVVDADYLRTVSCVVCSFLLRGACQITCGDRICRSCIPSTTFTCPACGTSVDPSAKLAYFVDKHCQKDIRELVVVCKCSEKFPLEQWEEYHLIMCPALVKDKPPGEERAISTVLVQRFSSELEVVKTDLGEMKKMVKSLKRVEMIEKELASIRAVLEMLQQKIEERSLSETVTELVANVEQHKGTLAQMSKTIDDLGASVPRFETMLEEMNLKVEILEVKVCTGVYVWKINELARRRREAQNGRTISLYSPPFYTSPHGYRLCLRAYLNGDGDGKGTHISLFVVIMKSEFDDLLAWPFTHEVTLTLINQKYPTEPKKCITHKFKPSPKSSSFQKPVETFNIASGFPSFTKIETLSDSNFNKNDTVYFRVKLDPPSNDKTSPDTYSYY